MADKELPAWENDPLSNFLRDAEYNVRATAINMPDVFAALQKLHSAFFEVQSAIEKDNKDHLLVPRLFLPRAHASLMGATRLVMAGQWPEAFPVLRMAIEQAWYALYISTDQTGARGCLVREE